MALRIRYVFTPGSSLGYSLERLADGLYYDFSIAGFTATPTSQINTLTATSGNLIGLYRDTITSTPQTIFPNGEYAVNIHNLGASNLVVAVLGAIMAGGDSAPVFPAAAVDPWSAILPGSYGSKSAGLIIGTFLDAKVSSISSGSGGGTDPWTTILPGSYSNGTAGAILGNYLDTKVSTRSTYAGGPVASVTSPVTVGTVNDKTGYALAANQTFSTSGLVGGVSSPVTVGTVNDKVGYTLSSSGLDGIMVESGINVRQALSPILAASAGTLSGAGSGSIVIRGGNVATTRITATTDNAGNRTTVTLSLPS